MLSDTSSPTLSLDDETVYRDLSKPIGALNEKRLAMFRERYESMEPGTRFLYGEARDLHLPCT